jgi:hypothetical protein
MQKKPKRRQASRRFIDFASSYGLEGQGEDFSRLGQTDSPEDVFRVWIRNFYSRERGKPNSQGLWMAVEHGDKISRSACNAFFNEIYYTTRFHKLQFRPDYEAQQREAFFWRYFRLPSPDKSLFQKREVQKRINWALKANDEEFFIRLGRELAKGKTLISKLKRLYFFAWAPRRPGALALCDFTDEALRDYARIALKSNLLELALVRKTRQRLKLIKRIKPTVVRVEKGQDGKPLLLDKFGKRLPHVR